MKENKNLIIYGVIALIIGFGGWYAYSLWQDSKTIGSERSDFTSEEINGEIIQESQDPDTAMLPPDDLEESDVIFEFQGVVDSLGDDYFFLEDILDGTKRKIFVGETTYIMKHSSEGTGPRGEPLSIIEKEATFDEIIVGLELTVQSEEDIVGNDEFTAKKIVFQGN